MSAGAANAKSVFLAALEKSDAADRAAYLDQACAGDAELRARVEELLTAHQSGSFPDFIADAAPAFDATQSVVNTPNDVTQTSVGALSADAPSLSFLSQPRDPGNLGRLDHFEVHSVLGQGGMGIVLKAFDESLDRIVAIKVLGSQYAANASARKRFIREAKAIAAVIHENVVHVHIVNESVPYLVMQYIKGVSLQDRIDRSGPLELKEILRIGCQIASGLAAAHAQGIVHRDIKPSNILLENGIERVKLTDFGLARAVDDASVTQSGVIAGTPMYMSPEQARGEQVDPRSDLFSLGSVLYAMCTGHAPFRASGTMAVMKRVIDDEPRSIRDQNADIPGWLEAIVFKLLEKQPGARFQSANEVAKLLEQHLAHLQQPGAVAMPAPVYRPRQRETRRPNPTVKQSSFPGWLIAVIAFVFVVPCGLGILSVAGWWILGYSSDVPQKPSTAMSSQGDAAAPVGNGPDWFIVGNNDKNVTRPPSRDEDLLQGTWHAISAERHANPATPEELAKIRLEIQGDQISVQFPSGNIGKGTFTVNPTANPKQITVKATTENNQAMEGIYKFEGDNLVLCFGGPADSRPTEFRSKLGTSLFRVTLQRGAAKSDPSIAGEWESSRGTVKIIHDPINGNALVAFGGSWDNGKGGRGTIQKGVYDPAKGTLLAQFVDEVANDGGAAALRVVFDGRAIVGIQVNDSGAIAGWSLWRKGQNRLDRTTRSIAGQWESNRGRVTLKHGPIGEGDRVDVTGFCETDSKKKIEFHDARLNPRTGILIFANKEDETIGHAQLMLSPDGTELVGAWADTKRRRGDWTMTRAKAGEPFSLSPRKVLPHLVGAWRVDWTIEAEPAKLAKVKTLGQMFGFIIVDPVAGGQAYRFRSNGDLGAPSGLAITTFDKDGWQFRQQFFDHAGYVSNVATGQFDAATNTLTMTNRTTDNNILIKEQRFVDADTTQWKVMILDKESKVLFRATGTGKRIPKDEAKIDENDGDPAKLPKELAVLDRLVGTWDLELWSRVRPGERWKAEYTGRKLLGGRFLETRERVLPAGEENITLTTFDPEKKGYHQWYWGSRWPRAEGVGKWDEAAKTLTWDCKAGEKTSTPITTFVVWKFVSDDKIELRVIVKDKDGKVLEDTEGTKTRRPSPK